MSNPLGRRWSCESAACSFPLLLDARTECSIVKRDGGSILTATTRRIRDEEDSHFAVSIRGDNGYGLGGHCPYTNGQGLSRCGLCVFLFGPFFRRCFLL